MHGISLIPGANTSHTNCPPILSFMAGPVNVRRSLTVLLKSTPRPVLQRREPEVNQLHNSFSSVTCPGSSCQTRLCPCPFATMFTVIFVSFSLFDIGLLVCLHACLLSLFTIILVSFSLFDIGLLVCLYACLFSFSLLPPPPPFFLY